MMAMLRSGPARAAAVRREPSLVPIRPVLRAINADAPPEVKAAVHRTEEDAIERVVRLLLAATGSAVAAYLVAGESGRPRCMCAFGAEPAEVESLTHLWQTTMSRQGLVTQVESAEAGRGGPRLLPTTGLRAAFFAGIKVRGPESASSGMLCILDPIAHALGATARQHLLDAHALIEEELLLRRQADHDPLTGLLNRRAMDERMAREWRRAARGASSLSVLAIDLDHFKTFNDSRGHLEGDTALRAVAGAMQRTFQRPGDLVGRIGGDEFLACLPMTTADDAARLADTLKELVKTGLGQLKGGELSVSVGVATLSDISQYDGGSRDLLAAADAALYQAKDGGRDQVVRSAQFDVVRPTLTGGPAHPRH